MPLYLHHNVAVYSAAPAAKKLIINAETAATTVQPLPESGVLTPDVTQLRATDAGRPRASWARGAGLSLPSRLRGGVSGWRNGCYWEMCFST